MNIQTLDSDAGAIVNFNSLENLVDDLILHENTHQLTVSRPMITKKLGTIGTKQLTKKLGGVMNKVLYFDDYTTRPFGYRLLPTYAL